MGTPIEHTHENHDGSLTRHSHPHGDVDHHHDTPREGEHVHRLDDGTPIVHQHDADDGPHDH